MITNFPIITKEVQTLFEHTMQSEPDRTPDICGVYGRGCRQLGKTEGANRANCMTCPLAIFAEEQQKDIREQFRMYYDTLMTDRFYINAENQEVCWRYFTHSAEGGMIVEHYISFSDVRKASRKKHEDAFYSALLEFSVSYQTEVGEPEFQRKFYCFLLDPYDSLDADEETMEYLISRIEKQPK